MGPNIAIVAERMIPLPYSESCERNKTPILEVLQQLLPCSGKILEIGSGTGQHVVHFAAHFPDLHWQPTDRGKYLQGLTARVRQEGSANILPPIKLDVLEQWPDEVFDAAYSANTAHIMGWQAVCATFAGLGSHLIPGGLFCLYGPFNQDGGFTAHSNRMFDCHLRSRDPQMGLRDLEALESLANHNHLVLQKQFPMPANNQILVFQKKD
jgi:cyclopropane fatty-acyl-phospholipid synthase-like methyltransferase